ncbi:MAG: hypothetical protein LBF27_14085 [Sphingobacterium sp.]|jgi:hypothetical protein|nr:hypothetical protein [Sphingobacterium sp.]
MSALRSISTKAYKKETKQHLLSMPDKSNQKIGSDIKVHHQNTNQMEIPNQISAIAQIIKQDWKKPYFGALPYLNAMSALDNISDMYYQDSAKNIIRYFLSNASTWRGETARAVKARLNNLLKN